MAKILRLTLSFREGIGGSKGGREGRTPPSGRPNSFNFMQFLGEFGKITPPWRVHAPTWGKSWIRHWRGPFILSGEAHFLLWSANYTTPIQIPDMDGFHAY